MDAVRVKCALCEETVLDIDEAMECGWWPSYWVGETERFGPVCPECYEGKLRIDEATGRPVLDSDR